MTKAIADALYMLRYGERDDLVVSRADLERRMIEIQASPFADFWLIQRGQPRKGLERLLYRALGLRTDNDGASVYVLTSPVGCAVVFLDDDFNEFRVLNDPHQAADGNRVRFELGNGQTVEHDPEEVVPCELAFKAVRYFFEQGKRPEFLRYRHSRK